MELERAVVPGDPSSTAVFAAASCLVAGWRAVSEGLGGLGADIEATEDGFVVTGGAGLRGGVLDARGDHRMAMLGAVAGLASLEGVEVEGIEAAAISYPGFEDQVRALTAA